MTNYSKELSDKFLHSVVFNKKPLYQIGDDVGLSPSDMSKLLRKYPRRWSERSWRETIERVGIFLGLKAKECWK